MKDINIPVTVGGVTFKNPFFVASGPTTKTVRQLQRIEQTGWAAASIKLSIDPAPYINRKPRYAVFPEYNALAFTTEKRLTFAEGLKLVEDGKKVLSDLLLMANITYAGDAGTPGWVNMAKKFEEAGADIIELNMCCPNMSYNVELTSGGNQCAAKQTGASLGQQADVVAEIVRAIKAEIGIPLFVKLTPEGGQIAHVAHALYAAGADAVGTTANRLGIPPINIDDPEKAISHLQQEISMSCYCGEWLKPLAQRDVYEIRKVCGMEPVVTGAGGVRNWHDAVELMLCGANLVGVCAETLINGYDIVRPMIGGLKDYMDKHGYKAPQEFVGRIVPEVKTAPEVTLYKGYAHIKDQPLYAPCKSACPLHVPVQGYVQKVAKGDIAGAYAMVASKGPIQSVCQFLCEHPCEKACVRGRADGPVAIRDIKRFVLDTAARQKLAPGWTAKERLDKKVAVVGSGAAGLTAAFELAQAGYDVTVFDSDEQFGGTLRHATPSFLLPQGTLDGLLDALKALGVRFEAGRVFGKDDTAYSLKADGFAAVVLTVGAAAAAPAFENADAANIFDSKAFVRAALESRIAAGERLVVCGGGFADVTAARTAVRLGFREVVLVTDGAAADTADAQAEGVRVLADARLVGFEEKSGAVCGVRLENKTVPGAAFTLPCTAAAAGFARAADASVLGDVAIENGRVKTDALGATDAVGVFCAGSPCGAQGFIACAASGLAAAAGVDALLRADKATVRTDIGFATVKANDVLKRKGYLEPAPSKAAAAKRPGAQRAKDFDLTSRVLTQEEAVAEAQRCLNCGCSEGCQLCKTICTDFAPYVAGCDRMAIDKDECVACGMCFNRCPNHNIEMLSTGETV
ncbi:MAG: FAD-dependent oxidoreductase [Oscillospiraceae bacterium]|nr:FAD-dependent oxidoreductase [Oscillospiraceae bacterium]